MCVYWLRVEPKNFRARECRVRRNKIMAQVVNLKNNGDVQRKGVVGFSWTTLFFGPFVPLLRGDWAWFVVILIANLCTFWLAGLVFCFIYNKIFTRNLLEKGYFPEDNFSRQLLVKHGIMSGSITP